MSAIQDNDIQNIIRKYIEDSYLPTVILNEDQSRLVESYINQEGLENDHQFNTLTPEVQRWITTSICTGVYHNSAIYTPSAILDKVWVFISDFLFPGRQLKKIKSEAREYISTAEREYNRYVTTHEDLLKQVQSQIDIINKRKPLMKEYILKKVAERLSSMGIKSEVADYPMESLDTRKFGLNDEFNDIRKAFQQIQENAYTKFLEKLPGGSFGMGPIVYILVLSRIREINEQIQNIKTLSGPIFEKMRSDNQKIESLYKALNNIAEIFTDINNRFIPAIEKILDLIRDKYHNTLSEIPYDILCLLRSITQILKSISEKCILPQAQRDELIESTISTSNNMSVEYENLRQIMANAA